MQKAQGSRTPPADNGKSVNHIMLDVEDVDRLQYQPSQGRQTIDTALCDGVANSSPFLSSLYACS